MQPMEMRCRNDRGLCSRRWVLSFVRLSLASKLAHRVVIMIALWANGRTGASALRPNVIAYFNAQINRADSITHVGG